MSIEQSQPPSKKSASLPNNLPQDLNLAISEEVKQESTLLPAPVSNSDTKSQWSFSIEAHKYVRDMLNNADNKAQRYIAFSSAFLIWLNSNRGQKILNVPIIEWRYLEILYLVAILGMAACALFSLFTIVPRLKGSKKGIIYFNSVAAFENKNDFVIAVLKKSEHELIIDELQHVFELSNICSKKFFWLKIAVWTGGIGLIAGILFSLLG